MAKYGGSITLKQQCKYEIAEMRAILGRYGVPAKEMDRIGSMICEAYYQAIEANANANVLEEKLVEETGKEKYAEFVRPMNPDGFMSRRMRYQGEHPELFLDGDEEKSTELAE